MDTKSARSSLESWDSHLGSLAEKVERGTPHGVPKLPKLQRNHHHRGNPPTFPSCCRRLAATTRTAMQGQPLPAARFLFRMDMRGAFVAVHRLHSLAGIPAAHTLAPLCQGGCGKPCNETFPPAPFTKAPARLAQEAARSILAPLASHTRPTRRPTPRHNGRSNTHSRSLIRTVFYN